MDVVEGKVYLVCDIEPVSNVGIAMGKIKSGKPSMVLLSAKLFDQLMPNQEPGDPVMVEW